MKRKICNLLTHCYLIYLLWPTANCIVSKPVAIRRKLSHWNTVKMQQMPFAFRTSNILFVKPRVYFLTNLPHWNTLITLKISITNPQVPAPRGQILSASAVTEGADIDWGPIGQNRDGFMNIFPPKVTSLKLRCDVKTTGDLDKSAITIRWMRNGGYVTGNFTQVRES